jgi:Protein of unknown function (DUF998)
MAVNRAGVVIGCAAFLFIIGVLHVIRQDLSPIARGMSRYAGSRTLAMATIAFLALATALALLASVLSRGRAIPALLVAAGGLIVVAVTPIGNPGTLVAVTALHTLGGLTFYLGAMAAMFFAPPDAGDRVLRWMLVVALGLFFGGAIGMPRLQLVVGLLQRGVFTLIVVWMVRLAIRRGKRRADPRDRAGDHGGSPGDRMSPHVARVSWGGGDTQRAVESPAASLVTECPGGSQVDAPTLAI